MRTIAILAAVLALAGLSATAQQIPALTTTLIGSSANGLSDPLYVCAPPGDLARLFVVQKGGLIKVRTPANQAGVWTTCLNISTLVTTGSEQGLLGMAFHPNFASNGYFYVYYTSTPSPGTATVRRYTIPPGSDVANPASGLTIITVAQPFTNHNGGTCQFGPDGYLYIGLGDGGSGNDPQGNGQNLNTMLGKMLRIDVDNPAPPLNYSSPPTNPFFGSTAGLDEIWAYGLRNPFRFSFDRLTGDVWIGDVGQDAQEEVDFQPATNSSGAFGGRNYGWRCKEGTLCTGLTGCTCTSSSLINPVTTLNTNLYISVIGGYVYRGCAIPQLRGHYIYGDYGTGQMWRLTYNGTSLTSGPTQLPFTASLLAGFGEDGAGELYIVRRSGFNQILKLVPVVPQSVGITTYGTGTPGCNGPHTLSMGCSPTLFNPGETITSTNGQVGTTLIGIVGSGSLPPGSDPLLISVETLVDLTPGTNFLFQAPVGPLGTTTISAPIPNAPWIVGLTFYIQEFFAWTSCTPSPLALSSSPALAVTIQP